MRRYFSGFTLVELLVIVTVIVALVALLLPAVENAITKANTVRCMNMQRQLWAGNASYSNDSLGWYVLIKSAHYYQAGKRNKNTQTGDKTVDDEVDNFYDSTRKADQTWWRNTLYQQQMGINPDRTVPAPIQGLTEQDVEGDLFAGGWWPSSWACPEARAYRPPENPQVILWDAYGFNWSGVTKDYTDEIAVKHTRVRHPSAAAQMTDTNDWHTTGNTHQNMADHVRWWDPPQYKWEPKQQPTPKGHNLTRIIQYRHDEGIGVQHFDGHSSFYTKYDAWPDSPRDRQLLWQVYY